MQRFFWGAAALVLLAAIATAQDSIKLENGTRVTGDIIAESTVEVVLVVGMGERKSYSRSEVAEVRRGTPLAGRVQKWLDEIDAANADLVFGVVEKAAKEKSYQVEAKRLAKRVLAMNPEHKSARKFLGHVKMRGAWYADLATAKKSVAKEMAAEGFVAHGDGWVKAADLENLKAAPDSWTLADESLWRRKSEVLREKGLIVFDGETYPIKEEAVVKELETLKERTGDSAQVAVAGACRVFCALGKERAVKAAENLHKARQWFATTFEVRPEYWVMKPKSDFYVFTDQPQLEKFLDSYELKGDPRRIKLGRTLGTVPFGDFSHAIHTKLGIWEEMLVSALGAGLTMGNWGAGVPVPDWLPIAAGHMAEIAVYGEAKVQFVAPDDYGRSRSEATQGDRNLAGYRSAMRGILAGANAPNLRRLYGTHVNEMTNELDIMGVVVLSFFLESNPKPFLEYMKRGSGRNHDDRFKSGFNMTFEEMDQKLRDYVGR